jgi:hypothetical protein
MSITAILLISLLLGLFFSNRIGGSFLAWAFGAAVLMAIFGKLIIIIMIFLALFALMKK